MWSRENPKAKGGIRGYKKRGGVVVTGQALNDRKKKKYYEVKR
jgi:hypothetical protein